MDKDNKRNSEVRSDNEIEIEPSEEGAEADIAKDLKNLRERLKRTEAEKREYLDGWQRAKADLINSRRKDEEEKKDFVKYANLELVESIVPVLDSFEIAMSDRDKWEALPAEWRKGMEGIYFQLRSALATSGLEEIGSLGKIFDPSCHEAVGTMPTEREEMDGKIVEVMQKGYLLGGKLIRTAKVRVAHLAQSV